MPTKKNHIAIFDTTLRDGEQSPGVNLSLRDKIEIATALAFMKVDVIEAGFPITSPGDAASVKELAKIIKGPTICALARAVQKDMDVALDSLRPAKKKRLHVFLATSAIHRKYKLKKAKDEIERLAVQAVKYARNRIDEVEFSPEDASRTERDFLYSVIEKTIDAGATIINIPDTVGYTTPYEFKDLIEGIYQNVPNINKAIISVHCHDDLGLSVANSLSAIMGGARQVECTVNGIGERAGNASMEEIVMALDTRKDIFGGLCTGIKKSAICETSRLVSKLTGMSVQPNKAIVGKNAFAHESGIHQHGMISDRSTYEIMRPQDVGFGASNLVLGKHSGRHALAQRLKKMGYKLNKKEIDDCFIRFKDLADKKKEIFEIDLRTIIDTVGNREVQEFKLESMKITTETGAAPLAVIKLSHRGKIVESKSSGDGPVDAAFKALDKSMKLKLRLMDYKIKSISVGKDALGEVTTTVRSPKGKEALGRHASTDVIEASVIAYIHAANQLCSMEIKQKIASV